MARKRIKTFAQEWGISVDDVLATCARLKLGHAHSDSSLLTPEEADRVKHDLDEQVHRQELLRRETVVETSAGKVVEKRLNATVMRRRHTEPEAGFAQAAAEPDVPFHFELEGEREDAFATPFLEERIRAGGAGHARDARDAGGGVRTSGNSGGTYASIIRTSRRDAERTCRAQWRGGHG